VERTSSRRHPSDRHGGAPPVRAPAPSSPMPDRTTTAPSRHHWHIGRNAENATGADRRSGPPLRGRCCLKPHRPGSGGEGRSVLGAVDARCELLELGGVLVRVVATEQKLTTLGKNSSYRRRGSTPIATIGCGECCGTGQGSGHVVLPSTATDFGWLVCTPVPTSGDLGLFPPNRMCDNTFTRRISDVRGRDRSGPVSPRHLPPTSGGTRSSCHSIQANGSDFARGEHHAVVLPSFCEGPHREGAVQRCGAFCSADIRLTVT
jgi:hypothetical protein